MFTFRKETITISKATLDFFGLKSELSTKHIKLKYVKHHKHMLGVMIPKKTIPLAVQRNQLRRRFRAIYTHLSTKPNVYAALLMITTKIQAEKKDINDILEREWKSLIKQLG